MIDGFRAAYQAGPRKHSGEIELRVGRLLLMLMLARVDGKSPVEYLEAARQQFVREFVQEQLPLGNFSLRDIADSWFSRLSQFGP